MQNIRALSHTPEVNKWLNTSPHARVLHVFDHVCNLINERREILSIVTPEIGNGPFNLVVGAKNSFSEYIHLETPIQIFADQLRLGNLTINLKPAQLWNPCPEWKKLHDARNKIIHQLTKLPITNYLEFSGLPVAEPVISNLSHSLAKSDLLSSLTAVKHLAGLGIGLTPAGDDFLMGSLYAVWIIHPPEVAGPLTRQIGNAAAPLTTSLSAAWLRAAERGEAGHLWHELLDGLNLLDEVKIDKAMKQILAVGETSGADALAGFFCTMAAWA